MFIETQILVLVRERVSAGHVASPLRELEVGASEIRLSGSEVVPIRRHGRASVRAPFDPDVARYPDAEKRAHPGCVAALKGRAVRT